MRLSSLLLIALLCGLPAAVVHAEPPPHFSFVKQDRQNGGGKKDGVAREAQRQNGGGRVLSVEPVPGGYRVKLLKDGDVRIIFVPE